MTSDAPRPSPRPGPLRRATRPGVPAGVAPGVDPAWAETFLLELRLADVPGRHIGDALAEVASHCSESGESARDAFGDPVGYARSLGLPAGTAPAPPSPGSLAPWVAQALGLLLLTSSAHALVDGAPVPVTTGHLVAAALLVGALAALGRWGTQLLRTLAEHPVLSWLVLMVHFGLLVLAFLLLDDVVVRVPGPLAVAVGAVALVVGTLGVVRALRRDGVEDDPVTAPLAPARPRTTLATGALTYGPALLSPVVAAVLVGVTLLLG